MFHRKNGKAICLLILKKDFDKYFLGIIDF